MLPVLLAIVSSLFYALAQFTIRVGLKKSGTTAALVMSQCTIFAVALVLALFMVPSEHIIWMGLVPFAAAGVMGPFLARYLAFIGVKRLGSSIAVPLGESKPLWSALGAVLLLGEEMNLAIAIATIGITAGIIFIGLDESGGNIGRSRSRKLLLVPLASGALYGSAHVLRKMGLEITVDPILGVAVQNAAALAVTPILIAVQGVSGRRKEWSDRSAWLIFAAAGILTVIAQLSLFYGLNMGHVVIVSPLASLSPLFVIIMVGLFLRKLERITWKIVAAAIAIVGSAAALALMPSG